VAIPLELLGLTLLVPLGLLPLAMSAMFILVETVVVRAWNNWRTWCAIALAGVSCGLAAVYFKAVYWAAHPHLGALQQCARSA
jgi:hypothetical protein